MRRLLPLIPLLVCLSAPSAASAQLIPTTTCGGSVGSEIPIVGEEPSAGSTHFRLDGEGDMPSADVLAALEAAYSRLMGDFGWDAPPQTAGGKILVRYGTPAQSGTQTSGDFEPATGDSTATCIVVPDNVTDQAAMRSFAAHELSEAVWHGMGALTPAADEWLVQGAAELMEDEAFGADVPDSLPPEWDAPLGTYPGGADAWLVLRGLTERFGTGTAGGPEQVVQLAFEAIAGGTGELGALAAAFTGRDVTLEQAFHDYSVAAFHLAPCGPAALPYCFADAADYDDAPREPHGEITAKDEPHAGEVAANHALRWISLPADLENYDVTVENTADDGTIMASVSCLGANGPVVTTVGTAAPGETARGRDVEIADDCASPTLHVTSASRTADDPEDSPAIGFEATLVDPTAVLTVQRFGPGTVGSLPLGIVCGLDCEEAYPVGTPILLGAIPDEGQEFAGWAGPCSGKDACSFTLDDATTVAAGFAPVGTTGGPTGPGGGSGNPTDPDLSSDTTAPTVLIGRPRFAKRGSRLKIDVTCPATEPNSCTGPVGVRMKIGKKRFELSAAAITQVAGGQSQLISFDLTPSVRKALRKRKRGSRVSVRVSAFIRDDAFNRATTNKTFKVKRPKRVR